MTLVTQVPYEEDILKELRKIRAALENFLEKLAEPPPELHVESTSTHWDALEYILFAGAHVTLGLDDKEQPYLKVVPVNGFNGQLYQHGSFEANIRRFHKDAYQKGVVATEPAPAEPPNGD